MAKIQNESLTEMVSEHYEKFFNKFSEINILPIEEWRVVHILAYICKKYEEYYGMKYSFKFNNPAPSKSYEVYQIKKLSNMLSSDPKILTKYIDWVFAKKIVEKKKRITSLGYFTHTDVVNEYKFKFLFNKPSNIIKRTDKLPNNVLSICNRHGLNIKTYAELAFIKKMPEQDALMRDLQSSDFDINVLDKIA